MRGTRLSFAAGFMSGVGQTFAVRESMASRTSPGLAFLDVVVDAVLDEEIFSGLANAISPPVRPA